MLLFALVLLAQTPAAPQPPGADANAPSADELREGDKDDKDDDDKEGGDATDPALVNPFPADPAGDAEDPEDGSDPEEPAEPEQPDPGLGTPPPPPVPEIPPDTPWARGARSTQPLGSWVLTSSLVAAGGAAAGTVVGILPLLLPFPGSDFLVVALPLVGGSIAGGIAIHQATDSILLGIIGGTLITGATVVVAVGGAIAVDKGTGPWVPNAIATRSGWWVGTAAGAALAAGVMTWALRPPE